MSAVSESAVASSSSPTVAVGTARGVAFVVLAAMLWGTTGTAQSFAPTGLSPFWVGYFRLLIASAFFIVFIGLTARPAHVGSTLAHLNWPLAILAGVCMGAYNLTFFAGVKAASVAVGTALAVGSAPIWAGALQLFFGRKPPRAWWFGTLLAVIGGAWLILGRGGAVRTSASGIAFCLAAGFSYALYALANKRLVRQSDPGVVTWVVFSVGALLALPLTWALAGPAQLAGSGWWVVLFLGVVATGVAYLFFSWGLRGVSGATGVSLSLMEPVTAFVLAIAVVHERPGWAAYVGLLLLLSGLALVIRAELRTERCAA
jgi:DME family drug/metabolite transporter